MNFNWAIEMLDKGKKVRRTCWEVETYMQKTDYGAIISNKGTKAYFMIEHFLADDWIEFQELTKIIQKGMDSYMEKTFRNPTQIFINPKMLGKLIELDCLRIYGMKIIVDSSTKDNEVVIA